jgi:hypothetical protein
MEIPRVRFETGLDELVDAHLRFWRQAPGARSLRRRGIWTVAAVFTGSLFVTLFVIGGPERVDILKAAGLALVVGASCWPFYRQLHDGGMRRRLRRLLVEQTEDMKSWLCEVELRPEGVWSRSRGVETLTSWEEVTLVKDAPDAVELHFRSGFAIVRDRAFDSPGDRATFLRASRRLAGD